MTYIIDRIEGKIAVCEAEDRTRKEIPIQWFKQLPKEGDCVIQRSENSYEVDIEQTKARRKKMQDLMDSLFE